MACAEVHLRLQEGRNHGRRSLCQAMEVLQLRRHFALTHPQGMLLDTTERNNNVGTAGSGDCGNNIDAYPDRQCDHPATPLTTSTAKWWMTLSATWPLAMRIPGKGTPVLLVFTLVLVLMLIFKLMLLLLLTFKYRLPMLPVVRYFGLS